ncbi:hypothetical protein GF374_02595 [Candidatus Woesearchaeota archaeon]|nr:hypothetical protein [Candidatus Woesearchaeota archaeon]
MVLKKPKSVEELRYLKRKKLDKGGKVKIWIFNPECPKCEEGYLRIPYNKETGRFKSRARDFVCAKCGYKVPKKEIKEETPIANIEYTCPHCKYEGEKQAPFKRTSTKTFKFKCDKCGKIITVKKA